MKNSIITKLIIIISLVILTTNSILLAFAYNIISEEVITRYNELAKTAANEVKMHFSDNISFDLLRKDKDYREFAQEDLQSVCDNFKAKYIYIYIPNVEEEKFEMLLLATDGNGTEDAQKKFQTGSVTHHEFNPAELSALESETFDDFYETDNEYGDVLIRYSIINDENTKEQALVGVDVSVEATNKMAFNKFAIFSISITISFVVVIATLSILFSKRLLKPARILSDRMKNFVANRELNKEPLKFKGKDEFSEMAKSFNVMTEEIESYISHIDKLNREQERQKAEIKVAHNIQIGLLQPESYDDDNVSVNALMEPARYVGGDFYDYFYIDENKICTVIADVSGKGVSASLFMSSALTVIRQYAELGYSPSEILFKTNNFLERNNPEQMFITAFVGVYDTKTRLYTYANAGHNPPFLIGKEVSELSSDSHFCAGLFQNEEFSENSINVQNGNTIFLYTDGVTESVNAQKELFGVKRLIGFLSKSGTEHNNCVKELYSELKDFSSGVEQSDDITMLALKVKDNTTINVEAKKENLEKIHSIILSNNAIPNDIKKKLCLVVEEIFINICSYAYEGVGNVEFSISVDDKVTVKFSDNGKEYNPLENKLDIDDYDIDSQVGGLGIYLVKSFADDCKYEYKNNKNILILTKNIK